MPNLGAALSLLVALLAARNTSPHRLVCLAATSGRVGRAGDSCPFVTGGDATLAHARPIVDGVLPHRDNGLIFWSMNTLPLSDVKARLSQIADEVHRTHERVTITKNGRSYLVLMAAEDLESMEATLELLGDPDAIARVLQARQDLAAGRGIVAAQMAELMAARRERGGG